MPLYQVFHELDFSTTILEGSVDLESNVNILFTVKEKFQKLTPRREDGSQYIFMEEEGDSMIGDFEIKLSDLVVHDNTDKYVLDMLSSLYLIPREDLHELTPHISTFVCEEARAGLENRSKFIINVDIGVLVRESEDIELIGGDDEEPSFNRVPASRSSIETLEIKKYGGELVETCVVCMEEFPIGVDVTRMPCSHIFHGRCIVKWLEKRNSCPLCRIEMPSEP